MTSQAPCGQAYDCSPTLNDQHLGREDAGKELPYSLRRTISLMAQRAAPCYRVGGNWYIFRLDREQWPVKGSNSMEVTLIERNPEVTPQAHLRDVELELELKNLMGKITTAVSWMPTWVPTSRKPVGRPADRSQP